jgi:hypothetical protein
MLRIGEVTMAPTDQWGLKESIDAMGMLADYFRYESEGDDFYEAAIFSVSNRAYEGDEALKISFEKKSKKSGEYITYVEFYQDGKWVWKEYPAFQEVKEFYTGVAFNTYLAVNCLSKTLNLLTEEAGRLAPEHVMYMEDACDDLKVYLETAISMRDSMPSFKNSNIPQLIEDVYRQYKLKGTFGEDVFPD